jgi:hypothetical protein
VAGIGVGVCQADDEDSGSERSLVRIGFAVAPVPLNTRGKDKELVGLGSYIVNVVADSDCNSCHSVPQLSYAPSGNPYFKGNPPKIVHQSVYLSGGQDFGQLIPGPPNIISRNLTPDKTGRPAGGRTWPEFREILRTGVDLDHLHPNCSATVTTNCFPAQQPFNGNLLQVMPWPAFQSMPEHEMRAVYEYLSSIPCISGPATGVLHNDCV